MSVENYIYYYQNQSGSGKSDFGPLYYTPRFIQQGRGFANFFSNIFQYLKPLFKSGLQALTNTALKTGVSALSEVGSRPLSEILVEHGKRAKQDLEQKYFNKFQDGKGIFSFARQKKDIKKKKAHKTSQLLKLKKSKKKQIKKSKLKTRILDIFSKKNK